MTQRYLDFSSEEIKSNNQKFNPFKNLWYFDHGAKRPWSKKFLKHKKTPLFVRIITKNDVFII